jgi:hypothetical protein
MERRLALTDTVRVNSRNRLLAGLLTRTAGLTLRRTDGKGSEAATRATSSRFVADQWPEAEPEE